MTNFARLLWYLGSGLRRLGWDPRKLRDYQEKRLRCVVKDAYATSAFYHERFRQAGISPGDVRTFEDLSKLPIITKDEFKKQDRRDLISKNYDPEKLKVVKTSGSSGQPFQVYLNAAEDDWRKAIYMRANISCGQKARDRWLVITSPGHFKDTTSIQRRMGIFAQTCVSVFANVSEQVEAAAKTDPDIVDGYSGSVLLLAKEVKRQQIETVKPRIVFGTAELIEASSRDFIEETLGAPYYDQFGCAELDRTAWQCPQKSGYHMDVDSVIMQFVDKDEEEVSPGERGEVVYTSLFNHSMPIIRYAIGDVAVVSDEECSCGRSLPLMKVVEGRKSSLLLLPGGRVMSPLAFANTITRFELRDYINQYRIVQKRVDLFKIYVEAKEGISEDDLRERLQAHMVKTLNEQAPDVRLNPDFFDVEFVDVIPVSETGKHKTISSEVSAW